MQATTKGPVYMGWGTDLWAPSEALIANLNTLNAKLAPARFHFSTPGDFFRAASATPDVPELSGEIPSSWANIITSMGQIWAPTMTAADTLVNAEKFSAINHALGYADYPAAELDSLWRRALESMDHNNYGQGGEIGDERKVGYAKAATLRGGEILRAPLRNIAERVQRPFAKSAPIVVFNPLSWTRDDVVKAHVTLFGDIAPAEIADYKKAFRLIDETGASVPFYLQQYSENISRALELIFVATGVPSLGYKTYYIIPAEAPETMSNAIKPQLDNDADAKQPRRPLGNDVLENRFYRVTLDRATSRIEIFDKDLNRAVLKDLEMVGSEDRGGNTLAIEPSTGRVFPFHVSSTNAEENNAIRAVIRIEDDVAGVPVTQRLMLYRDLKKVDIESSVDWKPGTFVKLEEVFPNSQPGSQVRYGIPFGSAGLNDVMPGAGPHFSDEVSREVWKPWRQIQDWAYRGNTDWGLTISTDRQLLTVDDSAIRVGLLRGTRFNPLNIVRDGRTYLYQQPESGKYVFRYSITSSNGDWRAARPWQAGMAASSPLLPVALRTSYRPKRSLPPGSSARWIVKMWW